MRRSSSSSACASRNTSRPADFVINTTLKTSRAVRLLRQLIDTHAFDPETLASELIVSANQLDAYATGAREMPLDRQLCLALLLIERVPALEREGYALRGQVLAAMAYASHTFDTGASRASFTRSR